MLFRKAKPPPLTAWIMQFSTPANLLKAASSVLIDATPGTDSRPVVMCLTIFSATGNLVGNLLRNEEAFYKDIRTYFRDTDFDVVTAEAIVWISVLMVEFWKSDKQKDREMFERIGCGTISVAGELSLEMIKSNTGFDFKTSAIERRRTYIESAKSGMLVEAFASVLYRSVGRRALAEPLEPERPPLELEWMTINIALNIFFSTMPLAYYETFKNMLKGRPDLFAYDED